MEVKVSDTEALLSETPVSFWSRRKWTQSNGGCCWRMISYILSIFLQFTGLRKKERQAEKEALILKVWRGAALLFPFSGPSEYLLAFVGIGVRTCLCVSSLLGLCLHKKHTCKLLLLWVVLVRINWKNFPSQITDFEAGWEYCLEFTVVLREKRVRERAKDAVIRVSVRNNASGYWSPGQVEAKLDMAEVASHDWTLNLWQEAFSFLSLYCMFLSLSLSVSPSFSLSGIQWWKMPVRIKSVSH